MCGMAPRRRLIATLSGGEEGAGAGYLAGWHMVRVRLG